jgi:hypothetical protein
MFSQNYTPRTKVGLCFKFELSFGTLNLRACPMNTISNESPYPRCLKSCFKYENLNEVIIIAIISITNLMNHSKL